MRISDWSSDVCSSDLQRRLRDRADQIDVFLTVSIGRAPFEATLLKPEYFGGSRANEIGDDDEAGVAKPIQHERQAAQRPFRIRIQIRVGAWLSQHGASDMPVEPSRSEEHTSELPSLMRISYADFCLKKKT